jgi:hypothetical protein
MMQVPTVNISELERLEGVIRKNLAAFYEVGQALMAIRDKRLYLCKTGGKYQTFEAYCRGVWDFNSSRARQLIMATEALENVKSVTSGNTPSSERQARPLSKLEPEQQRQAWQKAVETAPEGKVTAAHVARVVKGMTEPEGEKGGDDRRNKPPACNTCTEAMQFAVMAISQLERIRKDDPERVAALNRVKNWINNKL